MKSRAGWFLIAGLIVFAGCQKAEQKDIEISRLDRLVANENLNLKNQIAACQQEIENQKKLVQLCHQEKEKILQQADETYKILIDETEQVRKQCQEEKNKIVEDMNSTIEWITDKLPVDMINENGRLLEENERLKSRIAVLEAALKEAGIELKESVETQNIAHNPDEPNEPNTH